MKMKLMLAGLVIGLIVNSASPVFAATDTSFNIVTSPLPISLKGVPGSTLNTDIRIKNGSNHPETFKVSLMKFSAYGEEGKPAIQDRAPGDDYFDWVSFSPTTVEAPPNVWQTVKMTIKLPKSAAFGYYYAVVFSRAGSPQKATGRQNVLLGSTAVLVLVDAQVPNANRTAKVASFTANKRIYEFLPADFKVKVHNSGNVHLVPSGNIFISRGDKTIATLGVNSAQGNVLPNSNRVFRAEWNDGWPVNKVKQAGGKTVLDSKGQPVRELSWDLGKISKLKFGHYNAHLLLAYDNGKRDVPLEAVVSFWIIPWRAIAVVLVIAVFVGIGLWSTGRNAFRRLRRKK